jgi:tRNA nucleotidyltransferase (CCA-adding enzyme)
LATADDRRPASPNARLAAYLVGGAVRDLLRSVLSREELLSSDDLEQGLLLQDIDLVVDGGARSTNAGAGVKLARSLQAAYPQARLEIHSKFQTAAVI